MHQNPFAPAIGYPCPYPYTDRPQEPAAATNSNPHNIAAGIAYPYENHNPNYVPQPGQPAKFNCCHCCIAILVFIIIFALTYFTSAMVLSPEPPEVSINSLSVSDFNISNNQVSGKWDVQLQFRNPNSKTGIHYSSSHCGLYYHGESLTGVRLKPFHQGKIDQTLVNATLAVYGTYLEDRSVDSISIERIAKGSLAFDLDLNFSSVISGNMPFRDSGDLKVHCLDVAVGIPASSSSGKMIGLPKSCITF